jgi:hypothetical protein
LVGQDIEQLDAFIGKQVLAVLAEDFGLPEQVRRRGMDADNFRAPYPYRDDGMLVWEAIKDWVSAYLDLYYGEGGKEGSVERIANDYELQASSKN